MPDINPVSEFSAPLWGGGHSGNPLHPVLNMKLVLKDLLFSGIPLNKDQAVVIDYFHLTWAQIYYGFVPGAITVFGI